MNSFRTAVCDFHDIKYHNMKNSLEGKKTKRKCKFAHSEHELRYEVCSNKDCSCIKGHVEKENEFQYWKRRIFMREGNKFLVTIYIIQMYPSKKKYRIETYYTIDSSRKEYAKIFPSLSLQSVLELFYIPKKLMIGKVTEKKEKEEEEIKYIETGWSGKKWSNEPKFSRENTIRYKYLHNIQLISVQKFINNKIFDVNLIRLIINFMNIKLPDIYTKQDYREHNSHFKYL